IAVDTSGNTYITGDSNSPNFPTVSGGFQSTFESDTNCSAPTPCLHVFVTKLNSAGSALIYSTYLEGSGEDFASRIAVDASGNAYVTGFTSSTNFPTTAGAIQPTYPGMVCPSFEFLTSPYCVEAFITVLNATGSALKYSSYLGGTGSLNGQDSYA